MSSVSLYEEAFVNFRKHASQRSQSTKDQELLTAFLQQRGSPKETREAAESLQVDTQQKYGSKNVGDVEIPAQWIDKIMGNINNFVEAGNIAMKGAPESVGLAWFAVKLTLTAIQNNYELYSFFGSGLSDISEIMIIIAHYDRIYDERANVKWKPSAIVEKLFGDVISAYEAVLDFSFAIKCHLKAGTRGRILHGLKDLFGGSKDKFVSKLSTIAELKGKIVEASQGAFQDKTLSQLAGVGSVLQALSGTVNNIQQFQAQQEQWHNESMAKQDAILSTVQDLQKNTKRKSPWDYATDTFDANIKALSALSSSDKPLKEATRATHPGTCQWIFEHHDYVAWETSEDSSMLLIYGPEGTGKSAILASIVNRLRSEDSATTLFYLSCETSEASGTPVHYDAKSICNTFLSQVYSLAMEGEDVRLLEACNDVFKNPKSADSRKVDNVKVSKEDNLPDFADAFARIADLLKKNFILVIDGISNTMQSRDQEDLYDELRGTLKSITDDIQIKILLGCSSPTPLSSKDDFPGKIIDIYWYVRDDIGQVLRDVLKDTPGLSAAEQEEAEAAIREKAGSQFRYVCEAAIPFIREPFVRPLSKRLEALPGGLTDRYAEQVRKLKPNYVGLLQTALKWTLLAPDFPGEPRGREIMDDFYGTYDSLEETSDKQQEDGMFPPISQAELDQIRDAGDLFLNSAPEAYGDMRYYLRDVQQVREFCLNSTRDNHDNDHDIDQVCPRCKSEIDQTVRVSVDLKQDHLQMAITCLRHINNPVFQRRCGLLIESTSGQEDDNAVMREETNASVKMEGAPDVDGKDVARDGAEGEEVAKDGADEGQESLIDGPQDDAGYESDGSLDYEEIAENETVQRDSEEMQQIEDIRSAWERIRYELQFWVHHVRQAEDLWTSEEISESEGWKELFAEFDKFASNTEVFNRWQVLFPDSWVVELGPHKPLHIAALFGLTSVANHLIKTKNADPNELSQQRTALHIAARNADRLSMAKLLLGVGVNVNLKVDEKVGVCNTALNMWILTESSLETVKTFLDAGADPTIQDREQWNALHHFAYNHDGNDPGVVDLLLEHGVDINSVDKFGRTALHYLLLRREVPKDVLSLFTAKGANVNAEDTQSIRPLQMAAVYGEVETLRILLAPGVTEIDDPDNEGLTALHQAAIGGHTEVVRLLIEYDADPGIRNKKGYVALHESASRKFTECVRVLLDWDKKHHNVGINHGGSHNRTPFFNACLAGDSEISRLILDALIENKLPLSEINQLTESGRTPLRQAAEQGLDDVVLGLIKLAAEQNDFASLLVNHQDAKKGMNSLHRAAWGGHVGCVRHLVDPRLGTDTTLKDHDGHTALAIAYQGLSLRSEQSAFEEIVSILIDQDPDAARHDPELIATIAANGSTHLLKQLWRLKADLNMRDQYGWTPLEIARKFSRKSAEEFLSQQQAWASLLPSRWGTSPPSTTPAGARLISEDGTTITVPSEQKSHICISSDRPVPAGLERYYFEVTLSNVPADDASDPNDRPWFAIGFCTIGGAAITFPGWPARENAPRAKSYGYHGDDGGLYVYSAAEGQPVGYGFEYGPGDTVGCGVDFVEDEIFFTLNGERVGDGQRGVSGRLFPLLGIMGRICCVVNFEGEGLKWKGFRRWGVEGEEVGGGDVEGDGGSKGGSDSGSGGFVEVGGGGEVGEVGDTVSMQVIVDGVAGLEVR